MTPQATPPTTLTDFWGDTYISLADAARLLGIAVETAREWVQKKKLTGKQLKGHWWYVLLDEVQALLARQAEESSP